MDDSEMEMEWVEQLDGNLIDEFFFEQHVRFEPLMTCCWGDKAKDVQNLTLGDSMRMFLKLRKKGLRAHSWP